MSDDRLTAEVQFELLTRAGLRCECEQENCHEQIVPGKRCFKKLIPGNWDAHRTPQGAPYELQYLTAMCKECHQNTPSYGRPLK